VSNAFAKREFGKPLVEHFFPTVDLQKIVDCSGLLFPGHGTPTCIVFGQNRKPDRKSAVRITATLPGGGDLRTPPEESPLWHAIAAHNDESGYSDARIVVADRLKCEMAKHPWLFEPSTEATTQVLEHGAKGKLRDILADDIGVCTMTNADDIFLLSADVARRFSLSTSRLLLYHQGEEFKNWEAEAPVRIALPYDSQCKIDTDKTVDRSLRSYLVPHFVNVKTN
jgi:hypothetical protein